MIVIESYQVVYKKLVKTLVDNSHKTLKNLKDEIFNYDEIIKIVNEEGEENRTFEDLKKDLADKTKKLEEAFLNYSREKILKF